MKFYGIPNTSEWVKASRLTQAMRNVGYIEIVSDPPKLSIDAKLNGLIQVLNETGEWVTKEDPNYIDKLDIFVKKVFNTNVISKSMYERLGKKLLEIAEQK